MREKAFGKFFIYVYVGERERERERERGVWAYLICL